jgi:hypothetical protein
VTVGAVDEELRVVQARTDLVEPTAARITLDTRPDLITTSIARGRKRPLYVTATIDGQKVMLTASDRPAAEVDGAQRAVGSVATVVDPENPSTPDPGPTTLTVGAYTAGATNL